MSSTAAHNLSQFLRKPKLPLSTIDAILADLDAETQIQTLFCFVKQLAKNLSKDVEPFVRVNTISVALKFLALAHYPSLLFAEIYLMPQIQKVVDFVTSKQEVKQLTHYFEHQGHYSTSPNLQNLSYNFVTICCNFVQLAAGIKPLKVYQGREYSDSSIFQKSCQKLQKHEEKNSSLLRQQNNKETQQLRQKYIYSLSNWNQYQDLLVRFYVKLMEQYLREGSDQKYQLGFIDMLKYGEPSITSQALARLIQIVSSSFNFKVRTRALKLIDNLILWGDIQALLVVNFTEHIQIVVKNIIQVNGQISIDEGAKIYPEIQGQQKQKLQFYIFFLRCIQTWAQCYPKNDYFYYQNKMKSKQSVIYKLYKVLRQKKKFKFPQNLLIVRYQKESHANMTARLIRNQMILLDINGQSQSESMIRQSKTFQQVQQFYQQHKECLLAVLNKGANQLDENMKKLFYFKQSFQNYVQSISQLSGINQDIDLLIQNGLELIDLIQAIQQPYLQYLKQKYNYSDFKELISKICFQYFQCDGQKETVRPFRKFLSQKLKMKKIELSQMKVRSIPLQNELKMIVNDLNILQLRAKYKKKMEKSHSHRSSESSLSLEIYTRTKCSNDNSKRKQSEQGDSSYLLQNSLKKIVQQKYKKIEPLCSKNQKVNSSNKSKKEVKPISNELNNKSDVVIKKNGENSPPQRKSPVKVQFVTKSKQSQAEVKTTNTDNKNESSRQMFSFKIHLSQNQQYYQYLRNESFKYSYTLAHIIIFRSQQLVVQRVVCQVFEENKIKAKIYIILIPSCHLNCFKYQLSDSQSIHIADRTKKIPESLQPQTRYIIQLVGQMRKIPMKLPTIALFINNHPILQYILPFTINFFLDCRSNQTQVLANFRCIENNLHYQFVSEKLKCSELLFSQGKSDNLFMYFPFMLKLSKAGQTKELFLWQVKYNSFRFLIIIEYQLSEKKITVKLQAPITKEQTNQPFCRYIVNWLAHLLGKSQPKGQ